MSNSTNDNEGNVEKSASSAEEVSEIVRENGRWTIFVSIRNWSVDRWLALIGIIVAIICAWWAIKASELKPRLMFAAHPLKTEFRRADFVKDFGFTFKGSPVDADVVTSMQIALWNAGTREINNSDILESIQLELPSDVKIITATIKRTTRPVCDFQIAEITQNNCSFNWKILEPKDGAIIQLIYAGPSKTPLTFKGVVKGQDQPEEFQYSLKKEDLFNNHMRSTNARRFEVILITAFGILTIGLLIYDTVSKRSKSKRSLKPIVFATAITLFMIIITSTDVVSWLWPGPPFGW